MTPIHKSRFWHHDLIGLIANCWQVGEEYWHMLQICIRACTHEGYWSQYIHHNLINWHVIDIYVCNTGKEQVDRWEWAASKQSLQTPWAFFSHRPRSSCFTGGFPFCAPLQFGASSQCSQAIVNLYFLKLLWILDFADHPSTAWTLSGTPFQFTVSSLCAILIITNL